MFRLLAWRSVRKLISGITPRDQEIIDRSARLGLRRSMGRLDEWMDPELTDDAMVLVEGVGRFEVRARTDDLYHVLPTREPAILDAVRRLKPGEQFVDAGANIGFYTIAAATSVGPNGKVVAIEMIPGTAEILERHLILNGSGNVKLVVAALSDHAGSAVEAIVPVGKFGQASIARHASKSGDNVRISVVTATLDALLADEPGPIALIKLDLEGAELDALKGAAKTLERSQAVIFEALGNSDEVPALLGSAGFRLERLDGNNWLATRT